MHNLIAPLRPNENGIIVSLPIKIRRSPRTFGGLPPADPHALGRSMADLEYYCTSNTLSRETLVYSATFWDKVVWATNSIMGFSLGAADPFDQVLIEDGLLIPIVKPITGYIAHNLSSPGGFSGVGPHVNQIPETQFEALQALHHREPGRWTLSAEGQDILAPYLQDAPVGGLNLELINAIPIVSKIDNPERFLKWRETRADERRRLATSIRNLVLDIELSADPKSVLADRVAELSANSRDLLKVSRELDKGLKIGGVRISFDLNSLFEKGVMWGAGAGTLASFFNGEWTESAALMGLAAGLPSSVRVSTCAKSRILSDVTFPYASVLAMQYPTSR